MTVFTVDIPERLKEEFDSLSVNLRIPRKEIFVIGVMFFLYLSQNGILNHIQSIALSQQKPLGEAILEYLKNRIGGV